MEWLFSNTQVTYEPYPIIFFYLIALVGIVLLFVRPYWALLFSLFCLAARNFHAAVYTRTPFLGPYLNLNDLLEWIAIFAMLMEFLRYRRKIWAPGILLALFGLIIIGDVQSLIKYGLAENVMRRIWSTAIFPIMFLVSCNMVFSEDRARKSYWALFIGAVLAAIQHIIYVRALPSYILENKYIFIRTISYSMSGGSSILVAFMVHPFTEFRGLKLFGYHTGLTLIGLSCVLSLTRGLWVIMVATIILFPLFLYKKIFISRSSVNMAGIFIGILLIVSLLFPSLRFGEMLSDRFRSFTTKETFSKSYASRAEGQRTEINIWLNGSIILGAGSTLPLEYVYADRYVTGALGHVGYATYLSHYGVLGLLLYLVLLPLLTFKVGKKYYSRHSMDYGGKLVLVGLACVIMDVVSCLTSNHLLGATSHIQGLLYGTVWGLWRANTFTGEKDVKRF